MPALDIYHDCVGKALDKDNWAITDNPQRVLYLAIPQNVYISFVRREFIRKAIQQYGLKLIIFDPQKEIILEWHE